VSYQGYGSTDPVPFQQHQGGGYHEPDVDYGDEFMDDEEPRRGLRWLLIAGALVGAIGVGGALAYTYKSLLASHSGRVPFVKADPNVKVKPEPRGGRELASADKKAPEAAPAGNEPGGQEEITGPRPVKTIPITGGGTASPPAPPPSIPGITLYQPPQQEAAAPAAPPVQAPTQAPVKMQAPPGRVALGGRPPTAAEPDDDEPAAPPLKRASPPLPGPSPVGPPPRVPAKAAPGGGLGYVAVLSSQKTYLKALEIFADLQQKYTEVLGNKTPDVQEADLSARGLGTMYRLVVGPPGSHNAASGVCAQLKTAGYEGCWVKEY
jgi:hypothetical protein